MEESVTFRVSELKKIIAESSSEFKPKFGDGVESGNKTEAGKAYKEAKKRAKDFDGGGKEDYWKGNAKYKKEDYNGTTLDYCPENADEKFKKRVHAQVKGYTSEAEMNNKNEKNADFSGNEEIYQGIKKSGQEKHKKVEDLKKTGLQASKMPEGTFKKEEMYEGKYKTVYFKKTSFINEDYMMNRIPDEFKKPGTIFKMKDKNDNEYLLEWHFSKAIILEHNNKQGRDESIDRMKELMGYKSSVNETSKDIRLNEGDEKFNETLNKMRNLIK